MKEATGELNMTVITVVAIAAVAAFFYAFVWPNIKNTINRNQQCANATNCDCGTDGNADMCTCRYFDDSGQLAAESINCPNPSKETTPGT